MDQFARNRSGRSRTRNGFTTVKSYARLSQTIDIFRERSRLLPFITHEELEAAIQRYCQERKYQFRGALQVQLREGFSPQNVFQSIPANPDSATEQSHNAARDPYANKIEVQTRYFITDNVPEAGDQFNTSDRTYVPQESSGVHIIGRDEPRRR